MKNLINEKPTDCLHGRTLYNTLFVEENDIKNKNILDIGCGFGWFELNAVRRGCKSITGTELTEKDLETAKKYIKDPRINFETGSALKLPFENKKFDTVVSWEVLEHIPKNSENEMFREIHKILNDNGVFYLSTPFDSFFSKIFDPAWWLTSHRHYTKEKLTCLAKNNNFKIEKIIIKGSWWEIIGMWNLYIAKWIFKRRMFFARYINNKQDLEYKKEKGFTNIFIKIIKTP